MRLALPPSLALAILFGVLHPTLLAQTSSPGRAPRQRVHEGGLPASTPEEQGMGSVRLAQAVEYPASRRDRYYIHSHAR